MTRSLAQREAIARRRREQEAARLTEKGRPSGPSRQLRELPGTTFEDIFQAPRPDVPHVGIVEPVEDADGQGRLL